MFFFFVRMKLTIYILNSVEWKKNKNKMRKKTRRYFFNQIKKYFYLCFLFSFIFFSFILKIYDISNNLFNILKYYFLLYKKILRNLVSIIEERCKNFLYHDINMKYLLILSIINLCQTI